MVEQSTKLHKLDNIIDELEEQAEYYQQFAGVLDKFNVISKDLDGLASAQFLHQSKIDATIERQAEIQSSLQRAQDLIQTQRKLQESEYKTFLDTTQARTDDILGQFKSVIEQHVKEAQTFQETLVTQTEGAITTQAELLERAITLVIEGQKEEMSRHAESLTAKMAQSEEKLQDLQEATNTLASSLQLSERRNRWWKIGTSIVLFFSFAGFMALLRGM